MTLSYQQQFVLDGLAGRAAILDLTARYNRLYSAGDLAGWLACFRHSGATVVRAGEKFTDLRAAFNGGNGIRLVTLDHEISVDGVVATQRCISLVFAGSVLQATGVYNDRLVYERGGWYFTSRELEFDPAPRESAIPV
jgi:hypothetical protein